MVNTNNEKKRSLADFFGIWKDDKYWEDYKKEIRKTRDRARMREFKW